MFSKTFVRILLVLTLAVILSACAPAATPTHAPAASQEVLTLEAASPTPTEEPATPTEEAQPTATAFPVPDVPDDATWDQQTALFKYDPDAAYTITENGSEERDGVTIRDISFPSPYRGEIKAYLVLPAGDSPHPGILYAHWFDTAPGANANREEFLDDAVAIAQKGAASLLINTDLAIPGGRRWSGANSKTDRELVIKQVVEMRRATDVLINEGNVDPDRLAFVGHDFGAMFGSVLVAVDPRFKAAVFLAMVGDFSDWFLLGSTLGAADRTVYKETLKAVVPQDYLTHADHTAKLFQFADKDQFVTSAQANAIIQTAADPKQSKTYGSDHALHENAGATADRQMFLAEQLGLDK